MLKQHIYRVSKNFLGKISKLLLANGILDSSLMNFLNFNYI